MMQISVRLDENIRKQTRKAGTGHQTHEELLRTGGYQEIFGGYERLYGRRGRVKNYRK